MEFLGIGPLELLFIMFILLLVVGPEDMTKMGRTTGRFLGNIAKSETWQIVVKASQTLRTLPYKLMREAGFDDQDNKKGLISPNHELSMRDGIEIVDPFRSWTTPPSSTREEKTGADELIPDSEAQHLSKEEQGQQADNK